MKHTRLLFSQVIVAVFLSAIVVQSDESPIITEIRNEQPNSPNNNAIRIRLHNEGSDTYEKVSFCYQFHASKKFVFEDKWYLPNLSYAIDTLSDTTFQLHFWLKDNVSFLPDTYFPNESGIVFGLHYADWSVWNYALDYSYSSSPTFVETNRLFVATADQCIDEMGNGSVGILGYDLDKNGVRDDIDSLINARFPSDSQKRAAYRYVAKMIQSEWIAFYQNPQMSYEELLPYSVYVDLGLDFIDESGAENELKYSVFTGRIINTTKRILFNHKIDEVFAGKILPVAVRYDKRYAQFVEKGLADYQSILQAEMEADK